MEYTFKIDQRKETIDLQNVIAHLIPQEIPSGMDQAKCVIDCLNHPIGCKPLKEIIHEGGTIAIITSDDTRPMPSYLVLPILFEYLHTLGVKNEQIKVIIARGSHRNESQEELKQLVSPAVYEQVAVYNSGENGYTHLGRTRRGTDVDIDTTVVNAKIKICLGNVEYHYFAGYSGGAKAIMPGCSTITSIQQNHRFMVQQDACAGRIQGNPVREDIEEAEKFVHVDYILNVVLNPAKEIIFAASGDVTLAHRQACEILAKYYLSPIPAKADLVIVSQGGSPKDRNLYQTQKALDNAKHAVKDGGVILLMGSCKEGFGNPTFEEWMMKYQNPQEMIDALYQHFVLGGHKASSMAMVQQHAQILLVSDLPDDVVKKTFLTPFHTLLEAYQYALTQLPKNPTIITMPYGGSTLPMLQ